ARPRRQPVRRRRRGDLRCGDDRARRARLPRRPADRPRRPVGPVARRRRGPRAEVPPLRRSRLLLRPPAPRRLTQGKTMPTIATNLSMRFTEKPFLDRFAAAAEAGFPAVEYLFPYDHQKEEVGRRLRDAGLSQALFNLPPGDWDAGERGTAALPDRVAE